MGTVRAWSALQTLLADNTTGDISPQDLRDAVISALGHWYGKAYSTDAAIDDDTVVALATGGTIGINLSLPHTVNAPHRVLAVIKIDSGAGPVSVVAYSGQMINGFTQVDLNNQFDAVVLWSDGAATSGTHWFILAQVTNA